ncbi:hypothetical protein TNCV_902111 [Trichonephila clavipes]|nr:hypothetical protein TNCV_902111 [Trichonephila clavipes]
MLRRILYRISEGLMKKIAVECCLTSLMMSGDRSRLATSGNSKMNNHTKQVLETWEAKQEGSNGLARYPYQTMRARDFSHHLLMVIESQGISILIVQLCQTCLFRRRFVEWAQNEIAVVPDFHKRILFSDEAHFWLNGYVNKQNCRIWSEANPQVYVETPLHPEKLTVWCALWAGGILLQKR